MAEDGTGVTVQSDKTEASMWSHPNKEEGPNENDEAEKSASGSERRG